MRQQKADKVYIYNIFRERAGTKAGDNIFLIFEGKQWTYTEFYNAVQPVGNWLMKDLGIQRGEMVALDGLNSPEHLMLWLGLEAIGACPAFINSNLTDKPLVHCVKIAKARYLLADEQVRSLVAPVEEELAASGSKTVYYTAESLASLTDMSSYPKERWHNVDVMGVASLIYTSGTTGMPKGTVMTRLRELLLICGPAGNPRLLPLKPGDRMYTCLPLYHGAAHGLCILPSIGAGSTVVLSRKFSHNRFWQEVHDSKATHIQYVGELCRYLVNAPPSPLDRDHGVRMAWGNGMRPDVWEKFRERFGIETINELYAATDGLLFSANPNRGPFSRYAIGVRGALWHLLNGRKYKRILIDPDTQEVLRTPQGYCIAAKAGEVGEAVIKMDTADPDRGTPEYYGNKEAVTKRRIRDVFAKGDLWFRSGDLMRMDSDGRLFFVDRLGDTYRWKSENVSTNEVGDVVGEFDHVAESNVYGVLVPNADGRAGCAAIVPRDGITHETLDWAGLAEHNLNKMPRYAVPVFVRVSAELEYTGTMKMQKGRLRGEGIELDVIEKSAKDKGEPVDFVYWLPPGTRKYVPFNKEDLARLKAGGVKL
ncbi:fatty acid transporter [Microdochium trichocladiopsis]|uniref:Very long-chain fatty acid transport protein n=1 Tax=Microdochium trichocladiopsis TaxID=1682393 RepID=A0A9P8YFR3_9PEZI|nr:fatty acid transporter [Microdochium trichocladiopsis]KAH7037185.1 fatty acid transporter [Microdochium trichocladiopsis]